MSFRSAVLPFAWGAMSAMWAVVILVTDALAWPLAIWIATTVGPLTAIERRHRHPTRLPRRRERAVSPG